MAPDGLTRLEKGWARRCATAYPELAQDVEEGSVFPIAPLASEWPEVPHEIVCLAPA